MEIKIIEAHPNGENSFKYIFDRLDKAEKNSSDMRDVWSVIIPQIRQAERYAFSEANPSGWAGLDDRYKAWKAKKGYPTTIGIRTGALKEAATSKAITKLKKKSLEYRVNPHVVARERGATKKMKMTRVGQYMHYFDGKRPVFEYARDYINNFMKKTAAEYIKQGYEQG